MRERKCFGCGEFRHIVKNWRREEEEITTQWSPNKFEVLVSRVINMREKSNREEKKYKEMILREERLKRKIKKNQ